MSGKGSEVDREGAAGTAGELFLSYHRPDESAVLQIRTLLEARGIGTFLDRDQLVAGMPWPQALETGLKSARAVAVLIGPSGLGLWQKREMGFALDRQVTGEREGLTFPVVPVLLPGADVTSGFLFLNTWVDLREDLTDPDLIDALVGAVRGQQPEAADRDLPAICPYRGLRPFREEDAAFFFGREAFADRLVKAVSSRNLVAVIGPSGTGKSSVVQAGALPLLRRRHPPAPTWDAAICMPGDRPFQNLATALSHYLAPDLTEVDRLAEAKKLGDRLETGEVPLESVVTSLLRKSRGTDRFLLVIDQFEELFTQTETGMRDAFLTALLGALDRSPLTALLTLRGSFYDQAIASNRDLSDRLEGGAINLGPMTREELECAIARPAARVGLEFESGLAANLLDDVAESPGNLPLLEFALTELWALRQGNRLTHAAYEKIGRVAGAIAQRADSVYEKLGSSEQSLARRVFTRLVRIPDETVDVRDARQRVRIAEFGAAARSVIDDLVDARLLVVAPHGPSQEETVEVSHEALIRNWGKLRTWLSEDREFLLWRHRLNRERSTWERTDRDVETLLRGPLLVEAERWMGMRRDDLTDEERDFIDQGLAERKRAQAIQDKRRRTVLLSTLAASLVLLVLSVLAGLMALHARAEDVATRASTQLTIDPELSLLLAIEASKLAFGEEAKHRTESVLRQALTMSHVRARIDVSESVVSSAAFGPKGKLIVTASADGMARIWSWTLERADNSPRVEQIAVREGRAGPLTAAVFSPGGERLILAGEEGVASVWRWSPGGAAEDPTLEWVSTLSAHEGAVTSVAFSPDGERFLTTGQDGIACVWNSSEARMMPPAGAAKLCIDTTAGDTGAGRFSRILAGATFSPDGRRIVTASHSGRAQEWDAQSGAPIGAALEHDGAVTAASYDGEGMRIVTGSVDNIVRIWRSMPEEASADGPARGPLASLPGHTDSVTSASFSHDGALIITASRDRTARVWRNFDADGRHWNLAAVLRGHTDEVCSVEALEIGSGDKRALFAVTASRDGTARIWKGRQLALVVLQGQLGAVDIARFSPDGRHILSAGNDNTVHVWDWPAGTAGAAPISLKGHEDSIWSAEFSPDGRQVLSASSDNTARLWSPFGPTRSSNPADRELSVLTRHTGYVRSARFNSDGALGVTASDDRTARVWDLRRGEQLAVLGDSELSDPTRGELGALRHSLRSPDGRYLLAVDALEATLRSVDTWSDRRLEPGHETTITYAVFSPDSRQVLTAGDDGTAVVWSVSSGERERVLEGHSAPLTSALFGPRPGSIVTTSFDRTARVWAAQGEGSAQVLDHIASVSGAAIRADGSIVTWTENDAVSVFEQNSSTGAYESRSGSGWGKAGHDEPLYAAAFSPDDERVVTAGADKTARIWSWQDGAARCLFVLRGHQGGVRTAEFNSDTSRLRVLTSSEDGTARLWDPATGTELLVLEGHAGGLTGASFSGEVSDDRFIVTAGEDGTARVWHSESGALAGVLDGHLNAVTSASFSADGELILTTSLDRTSRVWETATGKLRAVMPGHESAVVSGAFHPEGTVFVTSSRDGTARVWGLQDLAVYSRPSLDGLVKAARGRVTRSLTAQERERFTPWYLKFFGE